MQKNGLVMDVRGKIAIVMTPDGEFCKTTAKPDWHMGMEVSWRDTPKVRRRGARIPAWQKSLAAASAACLALAAGLWVEVAHHRVPEAYAYVSLDINPSVEFTLSQSGRVLKAQPLDADGKALLTKYQPKGKSMQEALGTMVQLAAKDNMLPAGDVILVTTSPGGTNSNVQKVRQEAQTDIETAISKSPQAQAQHPQVYSLSATNAVQKVADSMKISAGKLLAYLAANQSGQKVTLGQLKGNTLTEVLGNPQSRGTLASISTQDVTQLQGLVARIQNGQAITRLSTPDEANAKNQVHTNSAPNNTGTKPSGKTGKKSGSGRAQQNSTGSAGKAGKNGTGGGSFSSAGHQATGKNNSTGDKGGNSIANSIGNLLNSTGFGNLNTGWNGVSNDFSNQFNTSSSGDSDTERGNKGSDSEASSGKHNDSSPPSHQDFSPVQGNPIPMH